ncbi:hypothetical protein BC831DRAFT_478786 [Entophlyctis helioformis]|nr:hypothetical protein BC831DRAFT_478786 [Entophlyctis helioformis]
MPYALRKRTSKSEASPASPTKSTPSKPNPPKSPTSPSSAHKRMMAELVSTGTAAIKRKTFPAITPLARRNQKTQAAAARVVRQVVQASGATPADIDHHAAVVAQVVKRGAEHQIKRMGANPIALLAKTSVRRTGIPLSTTRMPQVIARELARVHTTPSPTSPTKKLSTSALVKPSVVKARARAAAAKMTVNTQVLKRAVVREIGKRKPVSPVKSPVASKAKASSPKK